MSYSNENDLNFKFLYKKDSHDYDLNYDERPAKRLAPLGATDSPEPDCDGELKLTAGNDGVQEELIKTLEEEQEKLSSSLVLLTSHFAQIQFRLKQIVNDKSNYEEKLKELEEFAFTGVPDLWSLKHGDDVRNNDINSENFVKSNQLMIIEDLKQKLEELEIYAYKSGEVKNPPTSKVLANQKFIIEQLRSQLDINLENFVDLSENELKDVVNHAINDIVNPVKVREKLVDQLKTQIQDLERFIDYLQDDNINSKSSDYSYNQNSDDSRSEYGMKSGTRAKSKKSQENATHLIQKALCLLQMIAASQFGCHVKDKNPHIITSLSESDTKISSLHWGDIRAQLEVIIEKIIEQSDLSNVTKELNNSSSEDLTYLDIEYVSDDEKSNNGCGHEMKKQMIYLIRKDFCGKLLQLIQHGLRDKNYSNSLISVSCFSGRKGLPAKKESNINHPWDIIVFYYEMKNGRVISNSSVCKLSDSFDLYNIGGQAITNKQQLLRAIGIVLESHAIYRRSKDAQFKAFISLALNEKKIVDWLKIILKDRIILNSFYESWSYTIKMGFDDTLHSLRRLSKIDFDLPFDISIRQMSKIKDAF